MALTREQKICMAKGGVWMNGTCVLQGKVNMTVFKGNPCQGRFITMIEKASNPGELRTLAKVGLKSLKTRTGSLKTTTGK
jgi:hypothetical protein